MDIPFPTQYRRSRRNTMAAYMKWMIKEETGSETLEVLIMTAIAAGAALIAYRVFKNAKGTVVSKTQEVLG